MQNTKAAGALADLEEPSFGESNSVQIDLCEPWSVDSRSTHAFQTNDSTSVIPLLCRMFVTYDKITIKGKDVMLHEEILKSLDPSWSFLFDFRAKIFVTVDFACTIRN